MKKIAIYTWAISAGIVGFFTGLLMAFWLELEKPELSYLAGAVAIAFGVASGYLVSALARSTSDRKLAGLAFSGVLAILATQVFYWKTIVP